MWCQQSTVDWLAGGRNYKNYVMLSQQNEPYFSFQLRPSLWNNSYLKIMKLLIFSGKASWAKCNPSDADNRTGHKNFLLLCFLSGLLLVLRSGLGL
jgi:hypothetical protein